MIEILYIVAFKIGKLNKNNCNSNSYRNSSSNRSSNSNSNSSNSNGISSTGLFLTKGLTSHSGRRGAAQEAQQLLVIEGAGL